ncbi:hypothetical protein ALC53_05374 [Atta colombica]|uniref:Double jelly roll-like domain-containing protein n=1 Tax=Atta colombica TaxID=520822 RepID=A0A195BIP4_9HYME|nr:hypothetical protein ALC53_05374 [Atta colombica]
MSKWNANCWSSAARSLLWWLQRVHRAARRTLSPSVCTSPLDTDKPRWIAGAKSQLERRFVHIGGEYASFNGEFVTKDKRDNKSIVTKNSEIYRYTNLREWYEQHHSSSLSLEEFQERDSGWTLLRILNLTINVNKLNPLRAGCHIEVPREIATKRAVISVRSPVEKYTERESSYPHYMTVLNLTDIEFPWSLYIKNLSRLVSSQITRKKNKKFFCDHSCEKLQLHEVDCHCRKSTIAPSEDDKWLEFGNTWFAQQLNDLAHRVKNIISANVPMDTLSKQQWKACCSAMRCHGPAHSNCNLNYKNSFYIPMVFHNLSGYDAHFIIKEIATAYDGHVDVLPITKKKYISFTKHVDSTKDKNEKNFQSAITLNSIHNLERAKNDFEKNLYKLMNNAIFGKIMENVRNHDVKLITKWDGQYGAKAMIAKLNFHSRSVFAENLIAVEMRKGLMKDENNGAIMAEFVKLRAKMYAVNLTDRHAADKVLADKALGRVTARDDEIRIPIQQLYTLPYESFLYVERKLTKNKVVQSAHVTLGNNCVAFIFDEIRYELNGVEIDCNRNVSIISTLKNYVTVSSKLYLNSECYPYDDLNLDFDKNKCAILYDLYARFCKGYGYEYLESSLTFTIFLCNGPFVIIDCSRQNESVKSGTMDYCLIIHDRMVQYNPLTNAKSLKRTSDMI